MAIVAPHASRLAAVILAALLFLSVLGVVGARVGGAQSLRPAIRVLAWGAAAMTATTIIGHLVGQAV